MSSTTIFGVIIAVYLVLVYYMFREKLPAIWGLPLMAFLILVIIAIMRPGTVTQKDFYTLFAEGPIRIAPTIMSFFFAGVFARSQINTGIVENIVKRAAELGGDRPFVVAILLGLATAYVTLGAFGGGAFVCHVIALPILLSFGLSPLTASVIQGFGSLQGIMWWAQHWTYFKAFTNVTLNDMVPFLTVFQPIITLTWIGFVVYMFKTNKLKFFWSASAEKKETFKIEKKVPLYSLLCPILPIVFILIFKMPDLMAFIVSSVITILITQVRKGVKTTELSNMFTSVYLDGIQDMRYLLALMVGVSIILRAADFPFVKEILRDSVVPFLPSSAIGFIVVFSLAMLLGGVMRGPFQVWSLGITIIAAIVASGKYPILVIGGLVAVLDTFCNNADPTTGTTLYICTLARVSIMDFMKKVYVPVAICGVLGIILVTIYYGLW
jgi:hypothetical protein